MEVQSMNYLIVSDGTITNIIVADAEFAASVNAKPFYTSAAIGDTYDPPTLDKLQSATADLAETLANFIYQSDVEKLGGTTT
ncbi:hypothetical protein OBV_18240 [Oscillibacter valericigenes Sjm18-20]|nr:hypothetical protein OBV_18240 [Oscillibacter valericigenes Sjm18-20]